MSRIGRQPIAIPDGVELAVHDGQVTAKGPKGSLALSLASAVSLVIDGARATVTVRNPDEKRQRALWGLSRVLVANMIEGVTKGFEKTLEIHGIGYRAEVSGRELVLNVGFSHAVRHPIPDGITITVQRNIVRVSGSDKQVVGETAAKIRAVRKPEPYKGKGIRYVGEAVRRKAGKAVKAAGASK